MAGAAAGGVAGGNKLSCVCRRSSGLTSFDSIFCRISHVLSVNLVVFLGLKPEGTLLETLKVISMQVMYSNVRHCVYNIVL